MHATVAQGSRTCAAEDLPAVADLDSFHRRIECFQRVLEDWLVDADTTLACGRWSEGAVAELMPMGEATILPPAYEECFAGVREVRLRGLPHHLHVDLGRVSSVVYSVAPSVCFGFRPSFEARFHLLGAGGAASGKWELALMLSHPYVDGRLDVERVRRFFERARAHIDAGGGLVRLEAAAEVRGDVELESILGCANAALACDATLDWDRLVAGIPTAPVVEVQHDPESVLLLEQALALREASLVLYRDRMLVELQTERLAGVFRFVEQGHVSWQVGALDDHHCHLALGAVTEVLFSAEPVPCQQGRLNYTIWFLVAGACGNPYRRDGYFSIVLNRPYDGERERYEVIDPMLDLYSEFRERAWVRADATFAAAVDRRAVRSQPAQAGGACLG